MKKLLILLVAALMMIGCQTAPEPVADDLSDTDMINEIPDTDTDEIVSYTIDGYTTTLRRPDLKLLNGDRYYDFPHVDLSFIIGPEFETFNVFVNSSEYKNERQISLIFDETADPEEVAVVGDASISQTAIWNTNNDIEELADGIQLDDADSERSTFTTNNKHYIRIQQKSFGSTPISFYLMDTGQTTFNFHTLDQNEDILLHVLETAEFGDKFVGTPVNEPGEETDTKKTVLDYFKEIPDEYFWDVSVDSRVQGIDVIDEDNYYIHFTPLTMEGSGSFTIFIEPNGEYIFATEMKGCGPGCDQRYFFLSYVDGEWINLNNEILPTIQYEELEKAVFEADPNAPFNPLLVFPQHGTTIEIIEQFSNELLYKLQWNQGAFDLIEAK